MWKRWMEMAGKGCSTSRNWVIGKGWIKVGALMVTALVAFYAYPVLTRQPNVADVGNAAAVSSAVVGGNVPAPSNNITTVPQATTNNGQINPSSAQPDQGKEPVAQVAQPTAQTAQKAQPAAQAAQYSQPAADTLALVQKDLNDFILEKQRRYVSRSYGTSGYQCFTWVDLDRFKTDFEGIKTKIKGDSRLAAITARAQNLSDADRQTLYKNAVKIYSPTWAQMGYVDSKGNGQTDAGQQAERMIGEAIVGMVKIL